MLRQRQSERVRLQAAIDALKAQRGVVGNTAVAALLAPADAQLAALEGRAAVELAASSRQQLR
jgi:hypothetical protein